MVQNTQSDSPIAQLFAQSVVPGSARFWSAHFTHSASQNAVQAALSFAHLMDQLTAVSPEVIAEKSVWWHEELTDVTIDTARHPVTRALLNSALPDTTVDTNNSATAQATVDTMHRLLHGALMSQQKIAINTQEDWEHYCQLRFGSMHELLALAANCPIDTARTLCNWSAELHGLGVIRAPEHFNDTRILTPSSQVVDAIGQQSLDQTLSALKDNHPQSTAASNVLIHHELAWWKRPVTAPSPVHTSLPTGLRGMFASWRAARQAQAQK